MKPNTKECSKSLPDESCNEKLAWSAAMKGYCVPEDSAGKATQAMNEEDDDGPLTLFGDDAKLSANQRKVLMMLNEANVYPRIKLKQIALSFSGASVFFFSPMRKDGTPMPSSVLKFDTEENVRDEVNKTKQYGGLFGLTTPSVKDMKVFKVPDPHDPCAVMQIDLCGGLFGLPEFASAPPVHTFAAVIQEGLSSMTQKVDIVPIVNEALERRMLAFTMERRSVKKVNLSKMYKIVRFVGHGILNRAKEGAKRAEKTKALGAGFLNPPDIDSLDPTGAFLKELGGTRKTIKDFFKSFVAHEATFDLKFEREVVLGLCHNDLHGGNLLLDSQGLVWLIDFATVKEDVHVLMDLTKFMASCLFLYLHENIDESNVQMFAKLLSTTPDATTALPEVGGAELKKDVTASFVFELLTRLRHCMCIYEVGDDAPTNDGFPFAVALFSWSARMLSYNEPTQYQKSRALYYALVGAHRVLWDASVEVGPTASEWIEEHRSVWEGQKGRRLSTSATQLQVVAFQFELEFPRYLAQVGTSEAWSTDFLTREKVHVTEHCIAVSMKFSGQIFTRSIALPFQTKVLLQKMHSIHERYLPQVLTLDRYHGRMLIVGGSGSGKTMLTKQIFSEVAQHQLVAAHDVSGGGQSANAAQPQLGIASASLIPVRVPVIDFGRKLEAEPDTCLLADPVNDLLSQWVQSKYGQDSIPCKLISDVRSACLALADRRSSLISDASVKEPTESAPEQMYAVSDITGLLLLFDGLDEASTFKSDVIAYMRSLLETEPVHLMIMTSRPGAIPETDEATFSQLGFTSVMMTSLTDEQAESLAESVLRRIGDPKDQIDAVLADLRRPAYKTLREVPLILTLLVHVLRKSHQQPQQGDGQGAAARGEGEILKKTDIYQRAIKLILHQSDAAKYALREGRNDQAMVQRLEMLKSVRARKLFQTMSWQMHSCKSRAWTWSAMSKTCAADAEMLTVVQEAFHQGRTPIFEKIDGAKSEPEVQFNHLSFQELLAGEYASAIVQHAHATQKTRGYVNYFLSNVSRSADRDRLSEAWWMQVWTHVCEMIHPAAFHEWCDILAEDEQAKLRVGTCTARFWAAHNVPWENGTMFEVTWMDRRTQKCSLQLCSRQCSVKSIILAATVNKPETCLNVQWPCEGVAALMRHAATGVNNDLFDNLLQRNVHYGTVDDRYSYSLLYALNAQNRDGLRSLANFKADITWLNQLQRRANRFCHPRWFSLLMRETFRYSIGMDQIFRWEHFGEKSGVLEQAYEGTLAVTPWKDPNFSDTERCMTPLMVAAAGGQRELVRELLNQRADVHPENVEGCTALTFAAECPVQGTLECLEMLIAARADVNHRSGKTADRWVLKTTGVDSNVANAVCLLNQTAKLDILLAGGCDMSARNGNGVTPTLSAVLGGDLSAVMKLADAKADMTKADLTPYSSSLTDLSPLSPAGVTPVHASIMFNGNVNVIKFLHESKCNIDSDFKGPFWPTGTLFCACMMDPNIHQGDPATLKFLLEEGCDVYRKQRFDGFCCALHVAWQECPEDAYPCLFEHSLDPNRKIGFWGSWLQNAKRAKNQQALDACTDWLMMQSSRVQE
mmetsp:Transcript_71292/g.230928  ORF Transcript_71292/g.230928 Transcript_71292/m.230928 type:complete len:1583 (+) Transcript_71292:151-4899(+)